MRAHRLPHGWPDPRPVAADPIPTWPPIQFKNVCFRQTSPSGALYEGIDPRFRQTSPSGVLYEGIDAFKEDWVLYESINWLMDDWLLENIVVDYWILNEWMNYFIFNCGKDDWIWFKCMDGFVDGLILGSEGTSATRAPRQRGHLGNEGTSATRAPRQRGSRMPGSCSSA